MPLNEDLLAELIKREAERMGPEPQPSPPTPEAKGSKGWKKAADLAFFGGTSADTATTAIGLAQPGTKIREANPLNNLLGEKGVIPLSIGYDLLTNFLLDKALKNHPKIRNAAKFGIGAARTGQAISNATLIRDHK